MSQKKKEKRYFLRCADRESISIGLDETKRERGKREMFLKQLGGSKYNDSLGGGRCCCYGSIMLAVSLIFPPSSSLS